MTPRERVRMLQAKNPGVLIHPLDVEDVIRAAVSEERASVDKKLKELVKRYHTCPTHEHLACCACMIINWVDSGTGSEFKEDLSCTCTIHTKNACPKHNL